jgi:hypothetical protein
VARGEGAGPVASISVNQGYDNAGRAHDYFLAKHGLNGPDGAGGLTTVVVNSYFNRNTATGEGASYVYYPPYGDVIMLGNSGGYGQFDLTPNWSGATDVIGHEFTHGVLEHRPIGSLGHGYDDTGALNEGLSDVFGSAIEQYHGVAGPQWVLGDVVNRNRSIADPVSTGGADYYPARIPNADPHQNGGIPALAFKLLATGGWHPRPSGKPGVNVPGMGMDAAERIFFRAAYYYLTAGGNLLDFKAAAATAARDLYGPDGEFKTHLATDAVGIPYNSSGSLRAINISTRGYVGTGFEQMIAGFVLSGGASKEIILRATGPGLAQFGVPDVLSNPFVQLYSGSSVVSSNDNWGITPSYIADRMSQVGAFAFSSGSADSALIHTVSGGAYTAVVSGVSGGMGTALVEVYDGDLGNPNRLINLSTRLKVTHSSPAIAGFVVHGYLQKRLLIRAAGPALAALGVPTTLPDPQINLFWGSHHIYANDNWSDAWNAGDISNVCAEVGAFPFAGGSKDSALLVTLPPGAYTAQVTGGGADGISLLEVYEVP